MLRITVQETPQELILKLEGSLICSWSRSWKTTGGSRRTLLFRCVSPNRPAKASPAYMLG